MHSPASTIRIASITLSDIISIADELHNTHCSGIDISSKMDKTRSAIEKATDNSGQQILKTLLSNKFWYSTLVLLEISLSQDF